MDAKRQQAGAGAKRHEVVMRTFVQGRLGRAPEFARTMNGVAVCRLVVVGKAAGPVSAPPRVSLYLKAGEAERCASGLGEGDLIRAVGDVLPERRSATRQEVLVSERVRLLDRAEVAA